MAQYKWASTTLFVGILNIPVILLIGANDGIPAIPCICTEWVPTLVIVVNMFCWLCTLSFPFWLVPSGIAVSLLL